ncbi:Ti-type conjugative transfer relaxase TraA [Jiella mangrovi]|uniref:Ti-type conjugative transfer relaxase TraA n=1 Tax=Jiella mangrovi TaxID=2821407 RepID=A0ABS4BM80_9HYPH|nr:Ti-type conjugative transfer relaxase TraA [Jiella mangrovi]MBP0617804.1 Ti-type conjugative transfer relaxase TraA [Jiella mangrovi]
MAIFHFRQSLIQRSAGQSPVHSAAYRHSASMDVALGDRRADYSRKKDTVHSELSLPADAPAWIRTRLDIDLDSPDPRVDGPAAVKASEMLWNTVDVSDRRLNARLAREMTLALPSELSNQQNVELIRDFIAEHVTAKGYVADWAFHHPDRAMHNPHVHMMTTVAPLTEDGFGRKSIPVLDENGDPLRTAKGKLVTRQWAAQKDELYAWREGWAEQVNLALARNGHEVRVDHRSHEDRGITDLEPTLHHGPSNDIEKRGIEAELVLQDEDRRRATFENLVADPSIVVRELTRNQATFDDRDIARFIHRYAGPGDDFETLRLRVGALENLVVVQSEIHDPETDRVVQRARYTTVEMFEREAAMIASTRSRADDASFTVDASDRGHALDRVECVQGFAYTAEQRAAIDRLTGPEGLSVMVGYAGAGKSTVMNTVREIYETDGRQVVGAALAGKAAEGLQQSAGIASRTIGSWELSWANGYHHLNKGDVFVLDEAGMVASDQMQRLVGQLDEWGAKLVIIGDSRQLQPIGAGAAFRAIAETVGYVELTEVRRQQIEWQAEAAISFGRGDAGRALEAYVENGHVHHHDDGASARSAVIDGWHSDWQATADTVMLAHTNKDVFALNQMAREAIKQDGGLTEDHSFITKRGPRGFAVGDRVVFLENDSTLGIKNGTVGTVTEAEKGQLVVDVEHLPQPVSFRQEEYNSIDHGYALTVHKTQGATLDRIHVLAIGMMDAQLTYVAMTRHREAVTMHVADDSFRPPWSETVPNHDEIHARLIRDGLKDTTLNYEASRDYAWTRDEIAVTKHQTMLERLSAWCETRGLPDPRDVREAVDRFAQSMRELVGIGAPSKDDIVVPDRLAEARAPLVPALPERFAGVIERLDHVQAHSAAMGHEGNARRDAFHAADNALHRTPMSQRLLNWSQDVEAIVVPSSVVAIGRDFDHQKADKLLADLHPQTRSSLEANWKAVHAVSRAAYDVGLLETAHAIQSSHRAEREAERVEKDYRRTLDPMVTAEAAEPSPPRQTESPAPTGRSEVPQKAHNTTVERVAPQAAKRDLPDLLPAIRQWPNTIEEAARRSVLSSHRFVGEHHELLTLARSVWRDGEGIGQRLWDAAISGEAQTTGRLVRDNPEAFGALLGSRTIFMKPNAERQSALGKLSLVASHVEFLGTTLVQDLRAAERRETVWREAQQVALPGLSDRAGKLAVAIYKTWDLPYPDRASEVRLHLQKNPDAWNELKIWSGEAEKRFPVEGRAVSLPGIAADKAQTIDALRSIARYSVTAGEIQIDAQQRERQRAIERSRGIERDDLGWSR